MLLALFRGAEISKRNNSAQHVRCEPRPWEQVRMSTFKRTPTTKDLVSDLRVVYKFVLTGLSRLEV